MDDGYHKTLRRQISKYLGENPVLSPELAELLSAVSLTYVHADEDRALIERSLEISSKELTQTNKQISEQVVARTQELYREHARFIASINSLSAGFIMCDSTGQAIMVNMSVRRLLSLDVSPAPRPNELPYKPTDTQRHWTVEEIDSQFGEVINIKQKMDEALKTRKPVRAKDVPYRGHVLSLFFAPIINYEVGGEEVLGTVLLIEDVTEEKILERSRDEFFSIASHELRTPLTAIRGNTALIKDYYIDSISDPAVRTMLDDIHQSSVRLIEIVNDFLDASRLEQGKIIFKSEPFAIKQVVEPVIYELESTARNKGVDLIYNDDPNAPLVVGDQNRTKQIIYNLVGNALRFVDKGNVTIKLDTKEPGFVRIIVSDTGTGMSPESQSLLFHKFQQAGSSILTRDAAKGTGLGLYISKLLVEQMHGRIKLESSQLGVGSTFSFTMPIAVTTPGA